ncbi:hypothetical protein ANS017_01360 [Paraclostridium bifermentans]|uniref:hypothetical protein n=1 Tax=Paraclostridium bifermentans TaxID=1490 RepID=UPI0021C407A5|nr:hypothetical protein [Paraclostridium bifermentans]GKZ08752.1 hypothetical protein ANS017_01360 [Paraclostridium bifermentans]
MQLMNNNLIKMMIETIKALHNKFFKGTLDNKIVEYKLEEKEDIDHKEKWICLVDKLILI